MVYREYQPNKRWHCLVDSFWYVKGTQEGISRIYPDGYFDLIFYGRGAPGAYCSPSIRVSGMMTTYRDVPLAGEVEAVGIRFKPSTLSLLPYFRARELKNLSIPISDCSDSPADEWSSILWSIPGISNKIQWMQAYLLPQLILHPAAEDQLVSAICRDISQFYQRIDLGALAKQYHISLRQLERRFKKRIGVGMKEYQRIIRFSKALVQLQEYPQKSLLHIAFEHGYVDHSHLTREVLRMAGNNPSTLRRNPRK